MNNLIAFISDFGMTDAYIGIVKGVIKGINPQADIIDISHQIPLGDVRLAAFLLWQSVPYFPPRTVFLCIVDPGVGSNREPLLIDCDDKIFIGPNNGIFTYVTHQKPYSAWQISKSEYFLHKISTTFHGRDIFAPVAAHVSKGYPPSTFGDKTTCMVTITLPQLQIQHKQIIGEIQFFDKFGNGITSIGKIELSPERIATFIPWIGKEVSAQDIPLESLTLKILSRGKFRTLKLVRTFSDVPVGQSAAIIGSSGMIEIISNCASAEQVMDLQQGDSIILTW